MMIVKVKSKEHAFTIPVPYAVLRMGNGIATSILIRKILKNWLKKNGGDENGHSTRKNESDSESSRHMIEMVLTILEDRCTKQAISQLIRELQRYKGTVLVDLQAKDGTEVMIKL
ncbi:hypothetical protein D3C76_602950 [compost metagenome]